jgi:hypothetical protein
VIFCDKAGISRRGHEAPTPSIFLHEDAIRRMVADRQDNHKGVPSGEDDNHNAAKRGLCVTRTLDACMEVK